LGSAPASREASDSSLPRWLDETAAEKEQAELALTAAMRLAPPTLSVEEIVAVVEHCGGLTGILHQGADAERAALYEAIGVRPSTTKSDSEPTPLLQQRVGGATHTPSTRAAWEAWLVIGA